MQTESDATRLARVLPERPSPIDPPSFSLVLFLFPLFTSLRGGYQLVPDPRLIFTRNARTHGRNGGDRFILEFQDLLLPMLPAFVR